jgi:hypothetical protein
MLFPGIKKSNTWMGRLETAYFKYLVIWYPDPDPDPKPCLIFRGKTVLNPSILGTSLV